MMTGTGLSFSSVGVYSHALTAVSAASSRRGFERSTRACSTLPSDPMIASMMTTPSTLADLAMSGYCGGTYLVSVGALMLPPTKMGPDRAAATGGGASTVICPTSMVPAMVSMPPVATSPGSKITPDSTPIVGGATTGDAAVPCAAD